MNELRETLLVLVVLNEVFFRFSSSCLNLRGETNKTVCALRFFSALRFLLVDDDGDDDVLDVAADVSAEKQQHMYEKSFSNMASARLQIGDKGESMVDIRL